MIQILMAITVIAGEHNINNRNSDIAMRLAHSIGKYAGYIGNSDQTIDYEVVDKPGEPTYLGFATVQIRSNSQDVFDLSIDIKDKKVYDFNRCFVFEYPILIKAGWNNSQNDRRRKIYNYDMLKNGCKQYGIIKRKGDEARNLFIHSAE
jgi:hypothetical protein